MGTFVKVGLAGGAGFLIGEMLEPYLIQWFKPETDFAKKAAKGVAIGLGTGGAYYVINAFTKS